MRSLRRGIALALLLGLASAGAGAQEPLDAAFERDVLIVASEDACLRFDVYLAFSAAQQRRGLMFVRELPERTGMLFVYGDEQIRSMWMKNTFIPLDIAFARADGTIINVALETEPQSLKSIASAAPARYVLELNAGVSEKLAIGAGSRLLWGPTFGVTDGE
jgi:uncharacterized membrane protein (UPF0127 family)